MVPEGSWVQAPKDDLIIGLKELPEDDFPLHHTHIQFAHCYKQQTDWAKTLSRFPAGGGTLYDFEFLTDASGRRVAAFGYHAGYAGAALALLAWSHQLTHPPGQLLPSVESNPNESELVKDVQAAHKRGEPKNASRLPVVLVIGAKGRCGGGAVDLCKASGLPKENILEWDMDETAKGGPFDEIAEADVFVNCIYLSNASIPKFITKEFLQKKGDRRRLSVVCDVSCDVNNPNNPIPIYDDWTTFEKPTIGVDLGAEGATRPLSVISIDHLPSLLPREASEAFSSALLPSLLELDKRKTSPVWMGAEKLFQEKVSTLPTEFKLQ